MIFHPAVYRKKQLHVVDSMNWKGQAATTGSDVCGRAADVGQALYGKEHLFELFELEDNLTDLLGSKTVTTSGAQSGESTFDAVAIDIHEFANRPGTVMLCP